MFLDLVGKYLEKAFEEQTMETPKTIAELLKDKWSRASTSTTQASNSCPLMDASIGDVFGGTFAVQDVCPECKTEQRHTQGFSKLLATAFKRDDAVKIRENRKNYKEGLSKTFAVPRSQRRIKSLRQFFKKYEHMCFGLCSAVD